jgi:hypothetical protein
MNGFDQPKPPLTTTMLDAPEEWGEMVPAFRRELTDCRDGVRDLKDSRRVLPYYATLSGVSLSIAGAGVIGLIGYFQTTDTNRPARWVPLTFGGMLLAGVVAAVIFFVVYLLTKTSYDRDVDKIADRLTEMCQAPSDATIIQRRAETVNMPLSFLHASYGTSDSKVDVTDLLNGLILNGRLTLIVDNATMGGDPAENQAKTLWVEFTSFGKRYTNSFSEGTSIILP